MPDEPQRGPIPLANKVIAGVLLAVAIIAPLLVPTYARRGPELWGFPFFYWYQLMWVFLAALFTYGAYLLIEKGRR
ncbi:MAG: DUF3311 domain-containing protein [Jatrophihabitantaceae bacterium]